MQQLTLVKIGGKVLDHTDQLSKVLDTFTRLPGQKILIHGGGKTGGQIAQRLGIEAPMIGGRRITSPEMLQVALMVYGGLMNRQLVAEIARRGGRALGLTGADLDVIRAHKRPVGEIDYGLAGDIDRVNAEALSDLLDRNIIPVMAPLTHDGQGQMLNTNADTIAATVASALAASFQTRLVFVFERPGVLTDPDDDGSLVSHLTFEKAEAYKTSGVIAGGMLPKLHNAFGALRAGVKEVIIGQAHATDFNGTTITLS